MILDGKAVSKKILDNLKVKVGNLSKQPHLVVILVGNNPASQIYVKNKNGVMVPVLSIIKLKQAIGTASITRFNQYKSIQIQGQQAAGKSSGDAMNAMEDTASSILPADISYDWSGTSAQEREASGQTAMIVGMRLYSYTYSS